MSMANSSSNGGLDPTAEDKISAGTIWEYKRYGFYPRNGFEKVRNKTEGGWESISRDERGNYISERLNKASIYNRAESVTSAALCRCALVESTEVGKRVPWASVQRDVTYHNTAVAKQGITNSMQDSSL
jgi:hypothetical protein